MKNPVVSVIVPVRNDAERLRRCLRSVTRSASLASVAVEVTVADNGSTDDSRDVARSEGASVLESPDVRLGALRNRAADRACGTILAFVDADHEVAEGWIAAAVDGLADTAVGAVGAPYRPPSPGTWVQRLYDGLRRHTTGSARVEWLGSGNLAVRKADFAAVGGFDTSLETCEDVDLCRKLRARSLSLVSDSRLGTVHHGDPATLGAVFSGELWRGRDNVRVSFRSPTTLRTVASAIVPMLHLTAAVAGVVGLLTASPAGLALAAASGGLIALSLAFRTARMLRSSRSWSDVVGALAVAGAYEAGRALAAVGWFGHGRRREAATRGAA